MVEVKLWGSLAASAGGNDKLDIEARISASSSASWRERYPGVEPYLAQGIAVSINGVIYRDNWSKELPQDAEISCCRAWLVDRSLGTRL